jgi:hypothetical protein
MSDKGITLHSNGADFSVETSSGRFVAEIDPVTRQPTGRAKRFVLPDALRDIATLPSVATLSSQERSRLLDALIAQHNRMGDVIEAQGRQLTALTADCEALRSQQAACERRLDKDEQAVAEKLSTFTSRLRFLVLGR